MKKFTSSILIVLALVAVAAIRIYIKYQEQEKNIKQQEIENVEIKK